MRGVDIYRESLEGAVELAAKPLYLFFALALIARPASASILTSVTTDPGTSVGVIGVGQFMVSNTDMGPFKVTAYFSDLSSQTATWDSGSGSVPGKAEASSGARFRLTELGDTYFQRWQLENLDATFKLVKLEIDGQPGNTVFDLQGPTFVPAGGAVTPGNIDTTHGTTGSEKGYTFDWENPGAFVDVLDPPGYEFYASVDVRAIYSNVVNLPSQAAVGDLWTKLTIEFSGGLANGLVGPSASGTVPFRFYADTDTLELQQLIEPTPEPTSVLMITALGLVAACRARRRRLA